MCYTFIRFKKAMDAQGFDRKSLPYVGWFQPFAAWYGLIGCFIMTFVGGYTVFLPGQWDIPTFLFSYTMIGVFPIIFIGWKLIKRTKFHKPLDIDLRGEVEEIEEYTRNFVPAPHKNAVDKYFNKAFS
ncbi:general amino acid permease agp2 [Elasticomyces elasticus]|nr:general amino acid permease agp2 [Elasticomyces elasticus]